GAGEPDLARSGDLGRRYRGGWQQHHRAHHIQCRGHQESSTMSETFCIGAPAPRRHQQGITLVVVLILLVVMSVLGLAVLRSSAMQERMSANLRDRNEAMQAAETGLLKAQEDVIRGTFNDMWNGSSDFPTLRGAMTCAADGLCDRSDPNVPAQWETAP